MALISAWRRKPTVHLIAILDCILVIFTLMLHTFNFIDEEQRERELLRGLLNAEEHWGLYVVIWTTIFGFNILQFLIAHLLHMSVRPDYADAQLVQGRASRWLRFSSLIFIFLLTKFILFMVYFIKFSRLDAISLLVCLADMVFRMITVYIVKRFMDDLRAQYPTPQRQTIYSINIFGRPAPTNAA